MELKHLRSFAAVVRYGSFTKAAEALYLSQPTISAHVLALEEELNRRLILRTTKSLTITEKGREVYEYAARILELQERMVGACAGEQRRIIHLGASTIPSAYLLPRLLPEFGRKNPDTYFIIHQDNSEGVLEGLVDGVFDLGLVGAKDEKRLTCIPFAKDHMVLITPVTERFLAMQAAAESPVMELLKEPMIIREQGSGSRKRAEEFLEAMGVSEGDLNVTARINDQETIKNLVAGGLGVSILSALAARNYVDERRLLQFDLPPHSSRNLYLAFRKDDILPAHVREFVDFVRARFRE